MARSISPNDIREIANYAHGQGWLVHMDGARIANAVAGLGIGIDPHKAIGQCGVDVLSFGGTKNGMMFGEAVVFFDTKLAENFPYIRMQGMQLASKMRFISAQFLAMLTDDLWLKNAHHANLMAHRLVSKLGSIPFVTFTQDVETNQVFARIFKRVIPALQKEYFFYVWDPDLDEEFAEVRLVTSFDTTPGDVDDFHDCLYRLVMAGHPFARP